MRVKICGITQADQAVAIAHLGATALGFICVPASPRYIAPEPIGKIADALKETIQRPLETVGVFADAEPEVIETAVKVGKLSGVQLHGNESVEVCQQIRRHLSGIKIVKALRVRSPQDLAQAARYANSVDGLLLDAYHPQLLGGTGKTLDWASLQSFKPDCPWLLAGGLTPDNVTSALAQLMPDGIDLSSGVEVSPGIKDLDRVKLLFERLQPWLSGNGAESDDALMWKGS